MVVLINGGPVTWRAKLQAVVATSTCEAEYIAAAEATKEVLWITNLGAEIAGKHRPLTLNVDKQAAITLTQRHTAGVNGRTKHVDVVYHFVRYRAMVMDIVIQFVPTAEMRADVMTKGLAGPAYIEATKGLGVYRRAHGLAG